MPKKLCPCDIFIDLQIVNLLVSLKKILLFLKRAVMNIMRQRLAFLNSSISNMVIKSIWSFIIPSPA